MQLKISLSATGSYKVGDRIGVYCSDKKWYIGTVNRVGSAKFEVLYDNKVKQVLPNNSEHVHKVMLTETYPEPLTNKKYLMLTAPTQDLFHDKEAQDLPEIETNLTFDDIRDHTSDHDLLLKFFRQEWLKYNKQYFANKLQLPKAFVIELRPNTLGAWWPIKLQMSMNVSMFRIPAGFHDTLLHEMCHEAVSTLNPEAHAAESHHGPTWRKYAMRCGITPKAYANEPEQLYDSPEKIQIAKERDAALERTLKLMGNKYKPVSKVTPAMPAMIATYLGPRAGYVMQKSKSVKFGFVVVYIDEHKSSTITVARRNALFEIPLDEMQKLDAHRLDMFQFYAKTNAKNL